MKYRVFTSLIALLVWPLHSLAGCPTLENSIQLQNAGFSLAFVTDPESPPLGTHFKINTIVCKDHQPWSGKLKVDADMPQHGHGMNYKPEVEMRNAGQFQASGFLFHMPGEWRIRFQVRDDGQKLNFEHNLQAR